MATAEIPDERLLTIEEYQQLPDNGRLTELVRGRVVTLNPPKPWHGYVCSRVDRILGNFVEQHDRGYVMSNDSGVVTERDPDTLRGADVAFYSYARWPKGASLEDYLPVAPDALFEVLSPGDRWKEVLGKVAEYLKAQVLVVCVLDPERRLAFVFRPDQPVTILTEDQELTFPDVLPGFAVAVRRFFE
jgi:Uma2 family endonuclease